MVTDGSLENFGSNVIHVHASTLQPLQTLQSFTYSTLPSTTRHSPTSAAAAATAAAYSSNEGYQYHQLGTAKLSQDSHHYHGSGSSSRLDQNIYSKVEVISPYKSTLHGATAQVYSTIPSSSPNSANYDHTATLYSASNPTHGATITYSADSTGSNSSVAGGIVIGASQ